MNEFIESLIAQRDSLDKELTEAECGLEASKVSLDAATEAYTAANNRVKTARYRLMQVSTAIDAIEKASKAAEDGYVAKGVASGSPFRRQRRNIRAMVMDVLRSASDPMDIKEIMRATDSTKITVNKALTRLMMLGQVTPVENGWIVKKEDIKDYEADDEEEEREHKQKYVLSEEDEREHMYE